MKDSDEGKVGKCSAGSYVYFMDTETRNNASSSCRRSYGGGGSKNVSNTAGNASPIASTRWRTPDIQMLVSWDM